MRYCLLVTTLLLATFFGVAQPKRATPPKSKPPQKQIQWKTLDEVEALMKTAPRKVYIDIYTEWCGWCKVMDRKTFTNPAVVDYMNEHYYAIHLDAETADSLVFKQKKYGRLEGSKTNELAAEFMNNKLSYPTSVFFDEQFLNPQPVPGYLDVPTMETILTYIAKNKHKSVPFEKYKNEYKGTW